MEKEPEFATNPNPPNPTDTGMTHHNLSSANATPKRKRSHMLAENLVIPSNVTARSTVEEGDDDGDCSPRTRVTHRFRDLAIGNAQGAPGVSLRVVDPEAPLLAVAPTLGAQDNGQGEAMDEDTDDALGARKRFKPDEPPNKQPAAQENSTKLLEAGRGPASPEPRPTKPSVAFSLDRPGTPPLKPSSPRKIQPLSSPLGKTAPGQLSLPSRPSKAPVIPTIEAPESSATPPPDFRAALTWQEEEITIYDPDDSDDDGTGINGIGFKPTAAVAYARGMKRRQQLAEYRKREEREARARRNMRRRGTPTPTPVPEGLIKGKERDRDKEMKKKKVQDRRVRFLEASGVVPVAAVGFEVAKEAVKATR